MPTLPPRPSLDQLRHQARDLLRAARAGDRDALERLEAAGGPVALAGAQLAIAREHGFSSWPALKGEVELRTRSLGEAVDAFLAASVRGRPGRAARMLAQRPEIADYGFATAVVLGNASKVEAELARDRTLATEVDPRTGWTALHLACASRWHLDPARAGGLLQVVRLLLDAGAALDRSPGRESGWSPLRCAVASTTSGAGGEPIIRLLLERGARVADHDLYLAGFAAGGAWCVRLLLEHTPDVRAIARQALAGPIGAGDSDGVQLLLAAGADPTRYHDDDGREAGAVASAVLAAATVELIELLLAHGADPDAPGADGRSPRRLAMARGRTDVVELLDRHGASSDATGIERLMYACHREDRLGAERLLAEDPSLADRLPEEGAEALVRAAESGRIDALRLLLDLGVSIDTLGGGWGGTALHAAAYAGAADVVRELLERGAAIEARDSTWGSTPLEWAVIGSGERPTTAARPDWIEVVRSLIDAGADTAVITLSADEPKPPSQEVERFLRGRGIG